MVKEKYEVPSEIPPTFGFDSILSDIDEFIDVVSSFDIRTNNTRISRYKVYLEKAALGDISEPEKIFNNSKDERFRSDEDWLLYILREVHELSWIVKGLKIVTPIGLKEKLSLIVSGRDFAALDKDSTSRDTQFELRIASYFCQSGFDVDISSKTDVIAYDKKTAFFIECKRLSRLKQLNPKLKKANEQLRKRAPTKYRGLAVSGLIAVDVTKLAFSHNGLTLGMTSEHAKDIIQDKLQEIAKKVEYDSLFMGNRMLNQIMLQIHIPALILQPIFMPSTRFSSLISFRSEYTNKIAKFNNKFKEIFENGSKLDDRSLPAKKLSDQKSISFPEGTIFSLRLTADEVYDYLVSKIIPDKHLDDYIVMNVICGEERYLFTIGDMKEATFSFSKSVPLPSKNDVEAVCNAFMIVLFAAKYSNGTIFGSKIKVSRLLAE